jgi:hypothetical protein
MNQIFFYNLLIYKFTFSDKFQIFNPLGTRICNATSDRLNFLSHFDQLTKTLKSKLTE